MNYKIYTDGACSGNPGPGGYAFVVLSSGNLPLVVSGGKSNTTNNNMELMAIVRALKHLRARNLNVKVDKVEVYSDSAYCINSIQLGWLQKWKLNGWVTRSGEEVKNLELWKSYLKLSSGVDLKFVKVKGHSGDVYNDMADMAAQAASKRNGLNATSVTKRGF